MPSGWGICGFRGPCPYRTLLGLYSQGILTVTPYHLARQWGGIGSHGQINPSWNSGSTSLLPAAVPCSPRRRLPKHGGITPTLGPDPAECLPSRSSRRQHARRATVVVTDEP